MLYTRKVKVTWQRGTCTHFKKLGYIFTKIGDEFEVEVEHLTKGSGVMVECICDYCLKKGKETLIRKTYGSYLKSREVVAKDCCIKCQGEKEKECNLKRFGVTSTALIPEIKEKQKQTMLKNYGVDNPGQSKEIREKIENTNLEKYGFKVATQNPEIRAKITQTCLDKYGVENYNQTEESKEKHRITNLKRYGVPHLLQNEEIMKKVQNTNLERYGNKTSLLNPEIKEKARQTTLEHYGVEHNSQSDIIKEKKKNTYLKNYGVESYSQTREWKDKCKSTSLKNWGTEYPMQNKKLQEESQVKQIYAMYKNKSNACSSQQEYLWNLLGGELNYPISRTIMDIAFLEEKVYIEYDGTGHKLDVKYGKVTEEEFQIKEQRRYYFLKNNGWKLIRIISMLKDLLPQDEKLIKMIDEGKGHLNSGHSWIEYNIDESTVKCNQYEKDYDFGELRKIHKEDVKIS